MRSRSISICQVSPGFYSLLIALLLCVNLAVALDNDFSAYPQGSQQCLYDAADASACTGNTGTELNQCLCTNKGNFVYNTATCVAKNSPGDLNTVYNQLSTNCQGTGVTLAVSQDAFLAAATAATATTSSATATQTTSSTATGSSTRPPATSSLMSSSTSSPTSSPTSTPSSDESLSTGAKIGIGAGIGFGAIVLGLAAWFIFAYSRRKNGAAAVPAPDDEHNNQWHPPGSTAFTASTPAPSEWANENKQTGAVELGTMPWNPAKAAAANNQPLLSELGGDTTYHAGQGAYQDHPHAGGSGAAYQEYNHTGSTASYGYASTAGHEGHSYVSPSTTTDGTWGYHSYDSHQYQPGPGPSGPGQQGGQHP